MDMKTLMAAVQLANRQGSGGSSESIAEAVHSALEEAKASGAFKGDKGDKGATGATGATGAKGADGVSPTVTVSKTGKVTTIAITDATGTKTATISDGADGAAGAKGADGKTPVKGTDYWTEADKQEIIDAVVAAIKDAEAAE